MIHGEARLTAEVLEDARRRLIESQRHVLGAFAKRARAAERWVEDSDPLTVPVQEALWARGLDPDSNKDLAQRVTASLKHRVLTGRYTLPVYVDDPGDNAGSCARMEHDDERGMWRCRLESASEQATAESWHAVYGIGPACPYWQRPGHSLPESRLTPTDEEIEALFGAETGTQNRGEIF